MPQAIEPEAGFVLHPNFPAQFKHLAHAAAASLGAFLPHYGRSIPGLNARHSRDALRGANAYGGNI